MQHENAGPRSRKTDNQRQQPTARRMLALPWLLLWPTSQQQRPCHHLALPPELPHASAMVRQGVPSSAAPPASSNARATAHQCNHVSRSQGHLHRPQGRQQLRQTSGPNEGWQALRGRLGKGVPALLVLLRVSAARPAILGDACLLDLLVLEVAERTATGHDDQASAVRAPAASSSLVAAQCAAS